MYLFCFNLWSSFSPFPFFLSWSHITWERGGWGKMKNEPVEENIPMIHNVKEMKWWGWVENGNAIIPGKNLSNTWSNMKMSQEWRWKGSNTALGTICIYLGTPYTFQVGLKKAWAHWLPGELLALFDSCLPLEFRRVQCCLGGGGNMLLLLSMRSQKLSLRGFRIQMPEGCFDNNNTQSKKQQSRLGSEHNQASNNRTRG